MNRKNRLKELFSTFYAWAGTDSCTDNQLKEAVSQNQDELIDEIFDIKIEEETENPPSDLGEVDPYLRITHFPPSNRLH